MEHGDQQEQDAREENRTAGQHDTQKGEHRTSNRNMARQRVRTARANRIIGPARARCIRAGVRGPVTGIKEHPGPLLRVGSHQTCAGKRTRSLNAG